jgi:uncharacterized protein
MNAMKSAFLFSAIAFALGMPTPADAYSCGIPSIQSPAKRTVCFSSSLRKLNRDETAGYAALANRFTGDARDTLINDHWKFLQTREGCEKNKRCHESAFNAQLRLYKTLSTCKPGGQSGECVKNAIEAHRQELHKSL